MKKSKYLIEDFLTNQFHRDANHASLMLHMYRNRIFDNLDTITKTELEDSIANLLSSVDLMFDNGIISRDIVLGKMIDAKASRNIRLTTFVNSCKDLEIKKNE